MPGITTTYDPRSDCVFPTSVRLERRTLSVCQKVLSTLLHEYLAQVILEHVTLA